MSVQSTTTPFLQLKNLSIAQIFGLTAAALLASASIITNVSSAIARHADLSGKVVSGSIALAVALIATIGLAATLTALSRKQYALASMAALAFALSAAFSVSSALGVLGGGRLQASMTTTHIEGERTRLEFERRNAVNELATIAPTRSVDQITPELAQRLAVKGVDGCIALNGPITKQHCPVVAALQSELAQSNRRSAIVGLIAQHDRDIAVLGVPTIANKDATALAHVLAAIGWNIKADTLNTALMILGVLILEMGAALSLATVAALASHVPVVPVMRDVTPASVPAIQATPNVKATTAQIIHMAKANGGTLHAASKRELGRALAVSHQTVGRSLAALAATGALIASDVDGIIVKLAA
jgi:hypothetical protein